MATRARWLPPTAERVAINIHPEAREALRLFLTRDLAGTGIGYSEFIMRSIDTWRDHVPCVECGLPPNAYGHHSTVAECRRSGIRSGLGGCNKPSEHHRYRAVV